MFDETEFGSEVIYRNSTEFFKVEHFAGYLLELKRHFLLVFLYTNIHEVSHMRVAKLNFFICISSRTGPIRTN